MTANNLRKELTNYGKRPGMLLLSVTVVLAVLVATASAMAQSQDPLELYDANNNGSIDADEVITAVNDYFAGRIDRALAIRVLNLYLASAGASSGTPRYTQGSACSTYDADNSEGINRDEVIAAIRDYFATYPTVTREQVIAVIRCYFRTPFAPTGLRGNPGTGQITLNWTPVSGAGSYQVQQLIGSTWTILPRSPYTLTPTNPTGSAMVGGLSHNTSYQHKVRAVGSNGKSTWTSPITTRTNPRPDSVPKFANATTHLMFQKGESIDRRLPAATGGNGMLTYSITPATENGLVFDLSNHRITGSPENARQTFTYTLTVSDDDEDVASMTIDVTVLDISAKLGLTGYRNVIHEYIWRVLDHDNVQLDQSDRFDEIEDTTLWWREFTFQLRISASTGFQVNTETCTWPESTGTRIASIPTPPGSQPILATDWVSLGNTVSMVRCGIGSGLSASDKYSVWVKHEKGGYSTVTKLYSRPVSRSPHIHDHNVSYYVLGTSNSEFPGKVNPIETETTEGLFPSSRPSHLPGRAPNVELLKLGNYSDAANAWNDVGSGASIEQESNIGGVDVTIFGYWNPEGREPDDAEPNDGVCGISFACLSMVVRGREHILSGQTFNIEDPPRFGTEPQREWTVSYEDFVSEPEDFYYLPSILAHEFGHTLGLGHSKQSFTIMTTHFRELEPCETGTVDENTCGLADDDKEGVKSIYEGHTAD